MSIRNIAIAAALALTAGAATVGVAFAMPLSGPSGASSAATTDVQDVRWVCGPNRCWWRPNYVPAPYYSYYAPRPFYGYFGPRRYRYGWYGHGRRYWR
ncbi:MAG: hypothetical protein J0H17_12025 [Rhizobiales bacterium]|nr:hypothetical protein [Hyphomicrobiales bacterium]